MLHQVSTKVMFFGSFSTINILFQMLYRRSGGHIIDAVGNQYGVGHRRTPMLIAGHWFISTWLSL